MIDRIFSAVLTFGLLIAGTLAIGSEMFGFNQRHAVIARHAEVVVLPRVEVTGQRLPASAVVATERADPVTARAN